MRPNEPTAAAGTRPRPTTKASRTRTRILDAAARALSERGYAGMRLSDVADAAELQTPAIYYHFASRDELVEEVMWVGILNMREHLVSVLAELPTETPATDRILAAVEAHLRHELQLSDYATAVIRNAGQTPVELQERQVEEQNRYGEIWRGLFQDAAAADVLRPGLDQYAARMLVVGALNWTAEWWNARRTPIDTLVHTAQEVVRHGLFVDGTSRP